MAKSARSGATRPDAILASPVIRVDLISALNTITLEGVTLLDPLARQPGDSPWQIEWQWKDDGSFNKSCPNHCGSEVKIIHRWNDTLQTDTYRVCVKCRTRRRNAINYRTRTKTAKAKAKLSARRTRLRKRIGELETDLELVERELDQLQGNPPSAAWKRRCVGCGRVQL